MGITVPVPGGTELRLERLLLDANGTLTQDGRLIAGVAERVHELRGQLEVRIFTADTFGTLEELCAALGGVAANRVASGAEKRALLMEADPRRCAAIGNGANDRALLAGAALGIAVIGPEGASAATVAAADVVCTSVLDALDLLRHPQRLSATLRP